ncbi:hypothetical protein RQP46_002916 [Phenoliferia psychrophenolica]
MGDKMTLGDSHMKALVQVDPRVGEIQSRYPDTKKVCNLAEVDKAIIREATTTVYKVLNKRFLDPSKPALSCRYCTAVPATVKCTVCGEPYCNATCQKEDWKTHKPVCIARKQFLDERERQTLANASFDSMWSLLVQFAYEGQLEFFSALTSSLRLFTPTPLDVTHTLLIRLRYDARSEDPTLAFKVTSCAALPHEEVRTIVRKHPNHDEHTDVGLGELGSEAIRKRGEFKRGKDSCWYVAAVFFCEEGYKSAVVTTRYVELPKADKPDFKTQNTKRWEENYIKCMSLSGTPIKQPWGLSSPRQDEWLRQTE